MEPLARVSREQVRYLFNGMAEDYDNLSDLWYSWLFSRLHFFIARYVIANWSAARPRVLDVGCGTGFQSFLYALGGGDVLGIDIAEKLVAAARRKALRFLRKPSYRLFDSPFSFVERYNRRIETAVRANRGSPVCGAPVFDVGDATQLPLAAESLDTVSYCGSTLSFVEEYPQALAEMSRVLRPGGQFVVEVESRYNLDLAWAALDVPLRGLLEFQMSASEATATALSAPGQHVKMRYPFGDPRDPVYMDLRLFAGRRLVSEMRSVGLIVTRHLTIHSITNLIPSTFLDSAKPGRALRNLFALLARIEEAVPLQLPGCSLVLIGQRARTPQVAARHS